MRLNWVRLLINIDASQCWFKNLNWRKCGKVCYFSCNDIICDLCCQNETLLCTYSKLRSWYIIYVYILPFIMVVKILNRTILSKVMPIWSLVYRKYEMEKFTFKFWGLSLRQLPTGPEIMKITLFRLQILIWTFTVHLKHRHDYDFAEISKLQTNHLRYFLATCDRFSQITLHIVSLPLVNFTIEKFTVWKILINGDY